MIPAVHQYVRIGTRDGAPMRIFAQCTSLSFAGFIMQTVLAATLKRQFENAHLEVYAHDNRPHVRDIIACNPYIDRPLINGNPMAFVTLESFERDYWVKGEHQARGPAPFYADFIMPASAPHDLWLHALPNHARLRIPMDHSASLIEEMTAAGLEFGREHICVHYRHGASYPKGTASAHRDQNLQTWADVADRVQRELGLQVVVLGHPGMPKLYPEAPYVDLTSSTTMVQAYAVSRARFLLCSPSGPPALSMGMGTPTLCVNMTDLWWGWGPYCWGLPVKTNLPMDELCSDALKREGATCEHRTADEIMDAVRLVNDHHHGLAPQAPHEITPPNRIEWPPRVMENPWRMIEL